MPKSNFGMKRHMTIITVNFPHGLLAEFSQWLRKSKIDVRFIFNQQSYWAIDDRDANLVEDWLDTHVQGVEYSTFPPP